MSSPCLMLYPWFTSHCLLTGGSEWFDGGHLLYPLCLHGLGAESQLGFTGRSVSTLTNSLHSPTWVITVSFRLQSNREPTVASCSVGVLLPGSRTARSAGARTTRVGSGRSTLSGSTTLNKPPHVVGNKSNNGNVGLNGCLL